MKTINNFFSDIARKIIPYQWEAGINGQILRFDSNTLPTPPPSIKALLKELGKYCPINEYADPSYTKLRKLIARYEKVDQLMITITNSGDEALDVLSKTFLNQGDAFLIQPPTYEMFKIQCEINRGKAVEVPLTQDSFQVDVEKVIKTANKTNAKITFICNPNNPTGTVVSNKIIEEIIQKSPGIILIDEAYREFYGMTAVSLLKKYPNVVILRSFSKFGAMAGARIGYLIASPEISQIFNTIKFPMGVSYFSYKLAEILLEKDRKWISSQVKMIVRERVRLSREINKLGFYVYPSQANFLLVKIGSRTKKICEGLKKKNILIRDRSQKKYLDGCVRITVRNQEQNDKLINSLKKLI
jgi:histidinol-phosphate aminotransferase